jgi:hypothetical protein
MSAATDQAAIDVRLGVLRRQFILINGALIAALLAAMAFCAVRVAALGDEAGTWIPALAVVSMVQGLVVGSFVREVPADRWATAGGTQNG